MRRTLAGGLATCAGLAALPIFLLGSHTAAEAADPGLCPGTGGVSVVVDFGPLPGGTDVTCVPGGGGQSAASVTVNAGHPLTYVTNRPFVCRISGQPAPEQEPCNDTPPGDAYWALYWSDGDRGWTYASEGATTLRLKDGWSVGWRFQDGGTRDLPSTGPRRDSVPKPTPTASSPRPTSSPRPSTAPRPASTAPSSAAVTSTPADGPEEPATTAPTRSRPARPSAPPRVQRSAPEPSATVTPTSSASPTGDAVEQADGSFATVTERDGDGGSGVGDDTGLAAVAGLAGLSVLAGAAAMVAHRRGRT